MANTRYVYLQSGKIVQVNNVLSCTISSPSVSNGFYRDSPPTVVGGAACLGTTALGNATSAISVAGGTTQTIAGGTVSITADASVIQDDQFTHTGPRTLSFPVALLVFTTSAGVLTYDCFFKLEEVIGVTNTSPQGWTPTATTA